MKTLTVGAIAALCALAALATAGGHLHRAHARLGHGLPTKAGVRDDSNHYSDRVSQCSRKYNATDADVDDVVSSRTPVFDSRESKCVAGCISSLSHLQADNEFVKETFIELYQPSWGQQDATKAADFCEAEVADVPREFCEMGAAIIECIVKVTDQYSQ